MLVSGSVTCWYGSGSGAGPGFVQINPDPGRPKTLIKSRKKKHDTYPGSGSRGRKSPGSRIRTRITAFNPPGNMPKKTHQSRILEGVEEQHIPETAVSESRAEYGDPVLGGPVAHALLVIYLHPQSLDQPK